MSNRCPDCEILYINGVRCHEHGCPSAWKDEDRECPWCGQYFRPTDPDQKYCSDECLEAHIG
jgi:hypothetical protein